MRISLIGILSIMCFWVWICNRLNGPCYGKRRARHQSPKWCGKINPQNDFCCAQYGCDQMNGARSEEKRRFLWFLAEMIPGFLQPQWSDIEKWKKRYFKTIYVILTAAVLSWITLMQRFQSPDWISLAIVFIQIFFHKCRQKIYLRFVRLIADFSLRWPRRVQQTDRYMRAQAAYCKLAGVRF